MFYDELRLGNIESEVSWFRSKISASWGRWNKVAWSRIFCLSLIIIFCIYCLLCFRAKEIVFQVQVLLNLVIQVLKPFCDSQSKWERERGRIFTTPLILTPKSMGPSMATMEFMLFEKGQESWTREFLSSDLRCLTIYGEFKWFSSDIE